MLLHCPHHVIPALVLSAPGRCTACNEFSLFSKAKIVVLHIYIDILEMIEF